MERELVVLLGGEGVRSTWFVLGGCRKKGDNTYIIGKEGNRKNHHTSHKNERRSDIIMGMVVAKRRVRNKGEEPKKRDTKDQKRTG